MSRSDRAVFRLPVVSLVFPLLLFIAATPLATYRAYLLPLYLLPILALVYIACTRTSATPQALTVVGPSGVHRIPWADLDRFEFNGPRWAIAVAQDGRRTRLPMVRPRDLPRLAEVSGGWLTLAPAPQPVSTEPDAGEPDAVEPGTAERAM